MSMDHKAYAFDYDRFQAELRPVLEAALAVLRPGGRLAVIAYHSLEDRIVKRFLAREARDCLEVPLPPVCTCGHVARVRIVSRRVIRPSDREVAANRRARSARLRVAQKLAVAST